MPVEEAVGHASKSLTLRCWDKPYIVAVRSKRDEDIRDALL